MTKHLFAAVALAFLTPHAAFAADYQITVSGLIINTFPQILHGSDQEYIPFQFSFIVDSTAVTRVNAGTIFNNAGHHFPQDVYLIPRTATSSIPVTIGLTGAWSENDLINTSLGTAGSYDILLSGSLSNPTSISLTLYNSISNITEIGLPFQCSLACTIPNVGGTTDLYTNGAGITNIITT